LQEGQHALSHSPPNSPGRVNPLASTRVDLEYEIMQVDAQGNTLTIPQDLVKQIDAMQEEEVDPESLLLHEMYSRYLRGELNSIEDVRITFETLLGAKFSIYLRGELNSIEDVRITFETSLLGVVKLLVEPRLHV
jgi:hypothetical protein